MGSIMVGTHRRMELKGIDDVLYPRVKYACNDCDGVSFDTLNETYAHVMEEHVNVGGRGGGT